MLHVDSSDHRPTLSATVDGVDEVKEGSTPTPTPPPYKRQCRRRRRCHRPSMDVMFVTPEQTKFFALVRRRRFESPEMFVLTQFITIRNNRSEEAMRERMEPSLIEHVKSLWFAQGERCGFTGWQLKCDGEAIRSNSPRLPSVVRVDVDRPWSIGNVTIVCRAVRPFVSTIGVSMCKEVAVAAAPYITFRRSRPDLDNTKACERWYDECIRSGDVPCEYAMADVDSLVPIFYRTRSRCPDAVDLRSAPEELAFAEHCARLCIGQRLRCALTGMRMSPSFDNPALWPSVDRIDNSKPHVEGNVVISMRWFNNTRKSITIEALHEILLEAFFSNTHALQKQWCNNNNEK